MWRNILCSMVVLAICLTFVAAETVKGRITKVEGNKITVTTKKGEEGKAYDVAKDVKIYKMAGAEGKDKEEVKGGLTELKIPDKGIGGVTLTTNDKNEVTEIVIGAPKKKT